MWMAVGWTVARPKTVSTRLRLTVSGAFKALALFQVGRYLLGVHADNPWGMSQRNTGLVIVISYS